MIGRGIAASMCFAAALLTSGPLFAANRHVSAPQTQHHAKTTPAAKQAQPSNPDAQRTDSDQPAPQPNRRVIVGVGPQAMASPPEFRDIAMAPTG
jgi:predicted flap endonuclease-1-like 5' DNA nuclease